MKRQLPICRNDIRFSSTIYPHLVSFDNFRYLHEFVRLIPGFEETRADGLAVMEFQTRYTPEPCGSRRDGPSLRDTPVCLDSLQILQTDRKRVLLCPRILLFNTPSGEELEEEMETQREILELIRSGYGIDETAHFIIMPGESRRSAYPRLSFPVVTWERIITCAQGFIPNGDFWLNQLVTALECRNRTGFEEETSPAEPPPYLRVTGLKGLLPFERSGMFVGFHGGINKLQFQRRYNPGYLCRERSYRLERTKKGPDWFPVDLIVQKLKHAEKR